ncbi:MULTISPECIES: beta-propeller fold lactonase family protein [Pseudomonas]|uniref:YNCE-like beta-propeller domain-containing protein n=1 Tax=Pseudomonas lini TaxID=163011 RepID=A0A423I7N4_9PSED|nr:MULTISPECIES: beta-propeller fold lactonase family protein [Pseudomonas]RON21456.1 hypothetical protein BK663_27880 [Pseudomonas lini]
MTSAQQLDNAINLLRELNIPGRTKVPVSTNPDVWGLNIAAVKDNFPRHGLQCLAGPWGTMGVADRLVIFRGSGNQVLQEIVDENEVGKALTMFVESKHLDEGPHDISYTVTRLGQTPEPSEVMKVLVKLTRPGGHDDNDEDGHSKLIMLIPREILEGGIDQDNVADGVDITIERYPNIAVGDVIRLSWGGAFVFSLALTQEQVDGTTPIIVHVDEATIRKAGDSAVNGLAVVFEVYDVVDNRSEDWSAAQRVVVTIDQKRPLAPLLKEALNNVLDVDKLGDANGTAQVSAQDGEFFALGDTIFVRVRGTPVEGAPIDQEMAGFPLTNMPSIPEIAIPNALLRRLAKTQMVLSYRIQKADGSADFHSKGQFISVIGEIQRLKPPIAEDARQGTLDPDLSRTRIEIPFDTSFEAGQVIKLFWLGTLPDHSPYLPDLPLRPISQGDIDAKLSLYITVDAVHIKPLEGGTLELYYQLWIEDSVLATLDRYTALHAVRESEHASLLNVGEPRQELPEPTVDGVVDGVLDPDRNGTTLTATWLNTLDNDEVIREWEGSKTGLSRDSILLNSFTAGRPVPFDISAKQIKDNDGGTVSARYSVVRAGEPTRYSQPLTFSVGAALELIPTLTNPPYVIAPAGRVKNIELLLSKDDKPVSGMIDLTIPLNFEYPDGSSGTRRFMTDENGLLSVNGVKGHTSPGTYTLTADSGFASATANLSITSQGGVGTIPTGLDPNVIAVSPDGTRVYVCNSTDNTVSVLDILNLSVIRTIPVGLRPRALAVSPDGTRTYISNSWEKTVSVIDAATQAVIKTIPVGNNAAGLAVSPDGTRVYICNNLDDTISVIDTVSLAVILTVPAGNAPTQIVINPDGTGIYISSPFNGTVSVMDVKTLSVIETIPVGNQPDALAFSPDGTRVYVSSGSHAVLVIDTAMREVIKTIPVDLQPKGVAVSPDGTRAYVCNWVWSTVSVIDTVELEVIQTIPVIEGPNGVAVSPDGTRIFVCNPLCNFVSVIAVG